MLVFISYFNSWSMTTLKGSDSWLKFSRYCASQIFHRRDMYHLVNKVGNPKDFYMIVKENKNKLYNWQKAFNYSFALCMPYIRAVWKANVKCLHYKCQLKWTDWHRMNNWLNFVFFSCSPIVCKQAIRFFAIVTLWNYL